MNTLNITLFEGVACYTCPSALKQKAFSASLERWQLSQTAIGSKSVHAKGQIQCLPDGLDTMFLSIGQYWNL